MEGKIEPKEDNESASSLEMLQLAAEQRLLTQVAQLPSQPSPTETTSGATKSQVGVTRPDTSGYTNDVDVEVGWIFQRTAGDADERSPDLKAFASALKAIPPQSRDAAGEAVRSCKSLLNEESDPRKFLAYCDGDADAAAKRFAKYWEWRKNIFQERCFLPLNVTGSGAVPTEDLITYESGNTRILPCDSHGRSVLYHDPSSVRHEGRERVTFYFLSLLMKNPKSMTEGCSLLVPMSAMGLQKSIGRPIRGKLVTEAFPLKTHLHFVQQFESNEFSQDFQRRFIPLMTRLYRSPITIHPGQNPKELLESLGKYGFEVENLPSTLHGELESTDIECCDDRTFDDLKQLDSKPAASEELTSSSSRPEQKGRKRSKNAIASQQKRLRAREREQNLRLKHDELVREQARLLSENQWLTRLLQEAHNNVVALAVVSQRQANALQNVWFQHFR